METAKRPPGTWPTACYLAAWVWAFLSLGIVTPMGTGETTERARIVGQFAFLAMMMARLGWRY
jgi:hypothetical protein